MENYKLVRKEDITNKFKVKQANLYLPPLNNPITEITNKIIESISEEKERVIKEYTEKGFKYLLMKTDTSFDGNSKGTMTVKYHGFNNKLGFEYFVEQGYEVFDLDKVREYLDNI